MNTTTTTRERVEARRDRTQSRDQARRDKTAVVSRSFDPAALMRELDRLQAEGN